MKYSEDYYPVNSAIYMKDSNWRATLMSDRSQGGTSGRDGEIELMFTRNWEGGDGKGIPESNIEGDVTVLH